MAARLALPTALGSLALAGLIGAAAVVILQACALNLPFLQFIYACKPPAEIAARSRMEVLTDARADLSRRILELERELAGQSCSKDAPDRLAPLKPEGWANRDLGMFYGCWNLDTTYRTRNIDTGTIRTYRQWQMCFDTQGNGRQRMRADDGTVCEGTVQAQYAGTGSLGLIEPGNLACSDGGYIHQRQISCVSAAGGRASCETLQPETGGAATVGFERSAPRP